MATALPRAPANIGWYDGPTVVEALDALEPARPLEQLALRLPVQAIYKFDDRRIVAGRIESGNLGAGDEIVIMPAGKIAKIKSVESWPVTPLAARQSRGQFGRHHARPRIVHRTRRRDRAISARARATREGCGRGFSGCTTSRWQRAPRSWCGSAPAKRRATVVQIEKAVDPGELSSVETARSRATMSARSIFP